MKVRGKNKKGKVSQSVKVETRETRGGGAVLKVAFDLPLAITKK